MGLPKLWLNIALMKIRVLCLFCFVTVVGDALLEWSVSWLSKLYVFNWKANLGRMRKNNRKRIANLCDKQNILEFQETLGKIRKQINNIQEEMSLVLSNILEMS